MNASQQTLHFLIQDLNARYVSAIDNDRLEDWPGFFEEKCLYRIATKADFDQGLPLGIIYATSRDMLIDRVTSLRQANIYEDQGNRHMVGLPLILEQLDGEVATETNFMVVRARHDGETLLFATGRYLDRIKVGAGQASFRQRIVVLDSDKINTLLAIPL